MRRMVVILVALSVVISLVGSVQPVSAIPSDTLVFGDDFESGTLSRWTVRTAGNGSAAVVSGMGMNGTHAARITVPDYTSNSIAYLKRTLDEPVYALSAVGHFNVLAGGCDTSAGYAQGSVPFLRFFDTSGKRVVGLYRINGNSCSKTAKLYVQHSSNYYRTGKNIGLKQWNKLELRAVVGIPGASLVQVYVNDVLVYETNIADNGIKPFASVNIHNEHTNQVGDLLADNIRLATFNGGEAPTNPCNMAEPTPTTNDPGTVVLADHFESYDFSRWSAVNLSGDATATIQTHVVRSPNCAAKLHVTSNSSSKANLSKSLPAGVSEVWANGWFNVQIEGGNTRSNVPFFRLFTGSSRIVDVYRVNGAGQFYLRMPNESGGWTYVSLGRVLHLNTWYEVKVHAVANGNRSTVEVWLNGTQVYATTSATLGVTSLTNVMLGSEHFAQEGDLVADDVVIKVMP